MITFFSALLFSCAPIAPATNWPESPQCTDVYEARARLAAEYLKPGDQYVEYCEFCSADATPRVLVAGTSVAQERFGTRQWNLVLNGQPADLTRLFVRWPDGSFRRLSVVVGCFAYRVVSSLDGPEVFGDSVEILQTLTDHACTAAPTMTKWLDKATVEVSVPSTFVQRGLDPSMGYAPGEAGADVSAAWRGRQNGAEVSIDVRHRRGGWQAKPVAPLEPGTETFRVGKVLKVLRKHASESTTLVVYQTSEGRLFRKTVEVPGDQSIIEVSVPTAATGCDATVAQVLAAFRGGPFPPPGDQENDDHEHEGAE